MNVKERMHVVVVIEMNMCVFSNNREIFLTSMIYLYIFVILFV
jgi:hypothetical protein